MTRYFYDDWTDVSHLVTGDFDGDGIKDHVEYKDYPVRELLSNDSPNEITLPSPLVGLDGYNLAYKHGRLANIYTGDFNGDGFEELLYQYKPANNSFGYNMMLRSKAQGNSQMKVVGITNGLNHKTRIKYKTNSSDIFDTNGSNCSNQNPGMHLDLVSEVQEQKADGSFLSKNYTYGGVVKNPGIQDFVCFGKVTENIPDLGLLKNTLYNGSTLWHSPIASNLDNNTGKYFPNFGTVNQIGYQEKFQDSWSMPTTVNNSYKLTPYSENTGDDDAGGGNGLNIMYSWNANGQLDKKTIYKNVPSVGDYQTKELIYENYINNVLPTTITIR